MKVWRNLQTKELVFEADAEEYALEQLGIEITPKGKNGTYTLEQTDLICTIAEWYFSDNWIEEEGNYNDETDYYERNYNKFYREVSK